MHTHAQQHLKPQESQSVSEHMSTGIDVMIDGRNNSHMAIMMGIKDLCERADPLSEERSMKMREYAKGMLDSTELTKNGSAPSLGPRILRQLSPHPTWKRVTHHEMNGTAG